MLDVSSDCLVGELGDEVRFPVMLHALRDDAVEGAVERRERHDVDLLCLHFGNVAQRLQYPLGLLVRAVPACDQDTEQIPDPVLGDKRQGRRDLPAEKAPELLGCFAR